jgi:hypothetical protein
LHFRRCKLASVDFQSCVTKKSSRVSPRKTALP